MYYSNSHSLVLMNPISPSSILKRVLRAFSTAPPEIDCIAWCCACRACLGVGLSPCLAFPLFFPSCTRDTTRPFARLPPACPAWLPRPQWPLSNQRSAAPSETNNRLRGDFAIFEGRSSSSSQESTLSTLGLAAVQSPSFVT